MERGRSFELSIGDNCGFPSQRRCGFECNAESHGPVRVTEGLCGGAAPESLRRTAAEFQPVEHRLEFVAEINGVRFFNDSKATSVDAALKALEAFADDAGKIVLILGGRGKKAPYAPLAPLIRQRVRKLVLIGEDATVIETELKGAAPFEHATDMQDAVARSLAAAESG